MVEGFAWSARLYPQDNEHSWDVPDERTSLKERPGATSITRSDGAIHGTNIPARRAKEWEWALEGSEDTAPMQRIELNGSRMPIRVAMDLPRFEPG